MSELKPKWPAGPWKYEPIPGYQYVVEIEKKNQILLVAAAVPAGREEEIQAIMRLASKAPELYQALEDAIEFLENAWLVNSEFSPAAKRRMLAPWKKILAEARGETPDVRIA